MHTERFTVRNEKGTDCPLARCCFENKMVGVDSRAAGVCGPPYEVAENAKVQREVTEGQSEVFLRLAVKLSYVAGDSRWREHSCRVFLAPFCAVRLISYQRRLLGAKESMKTMKLIQYKAYMERRSADV